MVLGKCNNGSVNCDIKPEYEKQAKLYMQRILHGLMLCKINWLVLCL